MLLRTVVSPALGANCYVLAPATGAECVLIDPGYAIETELEELLAHEQLSPVAVLISHGHLDHIAGSGTVVGGRLPVHLHRDDAYRLDDPFAQLSAPLRALVEEQFGGRDGWHPPAQVVPFGTGEVLDLAGLQIRTHHAPGHTEGSTLYEVSGRPDTLSGAGAEQVDRVVFTGDVLFAGSIGRTDLIGGDHPRMLHTLTDVVLALPDTALVLPGHGPASTIGVERATNPFLTSLR